MSKREAVPKHSLPPQKQILSYMGRFINCPYAPDTEPLIFLLGGYCFTEGFSFSAMTHRRMVSTMSGRV